MKEIRISFKNKMTGRKYKMVTLPISNDDWAKLERCPSFMEEGELPLLIGKVLKEWMGWNRG